MWFNTTTQEKKQYYMTQFVDEWWDNGSLPIWITAQRQVKQKNNGWDWGCNTSSGHETGLSLYHCASLSVNLSLLPTPCSPLPVYPSHRV